MHLLQLSTFLRGIQSSVAQCDQKIHGGLCLCGRNRQFMGIFRLAVWLNTRPYEVLFSELTNEEASEIIGKLQEDGVDYKYQNDGTILVPAAQEELLKAQLVYEGYPKSGFTYSLFLHSARYLIDALSRSIPLTLL